MAEEKKRVGRPRKERKQLVETPSAFVADEEAGITEMQASFCLALHGRGEWADRSGSESWVLVSS
jgi:hypothetical protein